jgi:hypothetical protein
MFFVGAFSTLTPHLLLLVGYLLCFLTLANPQAVSSNILIEKECIEKVSITSKANHLSLPSISSDKGINNLDDNPSLPYLRWHIPKSKRVKFCIRLLIPDVSNRLIKNSFIDLPPPILVLG